jgi:alanine racemase
MSSDAAQAVLEIDLDAVAANWRTLRAAHPWGDVGAVIKADAYGLGAKRIAPALHAAGCRHFFVAYVQEAVAVRPLLPDAMIAVLGGLIAGTEPLYRTHRLTPVLGSLEEIARCAPVGGEVMLHLDTGMSRLGLDAEETRTLIAEPQRLGALAIRYMMTHLVSSEVPQDPVNRLQAECFAAACRALPPAPASLANSSGIFLGQRFGSALARPGAALYGVNPTPGCPNPMRSVVSLRARVLAARQIPAGATVGYNGTWTASRPSRIATAALGYADGFHRALSGRATAFFDGTPIPLVGRVSMDLATFDVTDHPAVQPGTWLEVLGPHQSPDDLARSAGTNGYEILTSLGRRFNRVYRTA